MRKNWLWLFPVTMALALVSCVTSPIVVHHPPWPPLPPVPSPFVPTNFPIPTPIIPPYPVYGPFPPNHVKKTQVSNVRLRILKLTTSPMLGVTLAWDPSPDSTVVGYRIYQGSTSGTYTNMLDAGNVTEITLDNLVPNSQYYFAATSYTADPIPLESEYSLEVTYTATPMNIMVGVQLLSSTNATGPWSVYATLPSVSVPKSDAPQFFQSVVTITNQ